MAGSAVVNAVAAGADLAFVGGLLNTLVYSLMVPADIRSPSDLKGKAVAISAPGSSTDMAMRLALRTLGLQPDRDVAVLAIGNQSTRMAALEAGYVAGTLLNPPDTILVGRKGFHALLDMSAMNVPDLHSGTVTRRAFIHDHRATVVNFMKAMSEAIFMVKRDKDTTLRLLSNLLQVDRQKENAALTETYETLIKGKIEDIPYPSPVVIEAVLAEMSHGQPSAPRLKPEQIVDVSIVQELEDNGFFRDLWQTK